MKRDKFLTEAIGYMRWSEHQQAYLIVDFAAWQGFGKLWEWAQGEEWFDDFFVYSCHIRGEAMDIEFVKNFNVRAFDNAYINPDRFADAVYEFLNSEEGKRR